MVRQWRQQYCQLKDGHLNASVAQANHASASNKTGKQHWSSFFSTRHSSTTRVNETNFISNKENGKSRKGKEKRLKRRICNEKNREKQVTDLVDCRSWSLDVTRCTVEGESSRERVDAGPCGLRPLGPFKETPRRESRIHLKRDTWRVRE